METLPAAKKRIGSRVRSIRTSQKRSQENVASAAGMAISFLALVERGQGNASLESLVKISNALGVPLSQITAGEELERFAELEKTIAGVPATMRTLVLKLLTDTVSAIKETEKTVKKRYEERS